MKTHKQLKQELLKDNKWYSECIHLKQYGKVILTAMNDNINGIQFVNYEVGFWENDELIDAFYFNQKGLYSNENDYNQALEEFKFQALIHKGFKS
tara:strand:+ start:495 stop:779 length:285 start_codon:yes stop_codon:yes gene_type:complete